MAWTPIRQPCGLQVLIGRYVCQRFIVLGRIPSPWLKVIFKCFRICSIETILRYIIQWINAVGYIHTIPQVNKRTIVTIVFRISVAGIIRTFFHLCAFSVVRTEIYLISYLHTSRLSIYPGSYPCSYFKLPNASFQHNLDARYIYYPYISASPGYSSECPCCTASLKLNKELKLLGSV